MQDDVLSNRLNGKACLFMGCTLEETLWIVLISFGVVEIISITIAKLLFNHAMLGFGIGLPIMAITIFIGLKRLALLKRDKPPGYYATFFKLKLINYGLIKNCFVTRNGFWSLGRYLRK